MKTMRNFLKIWLLLTTVFLFIGTTSVQAENIFSQKQISPPSPSQTKEPYPSFLGAMSSSESDFVKREEFAHGLYQFYKAHSFLNFFKTTPTFSQTDSDNFKTYSDAHDISSSMKEAVLWAHKENLMVGYPDNRFCPQKFINSQELFCVLGKMLGYQGIWENPSPQFIRKNSALPSEKISYKDAYDFFEKAMNLQPKKSVFSIRTHIEKKGSLIKKEGPFLSKKRWPSFVDSIEIFMPAIKGQPVYDLHVILKKPISKEDFSRLKENFWGIRGPLDNSFLPISSHLHDFHDNILIFHLPQPLGPHCIELKDELFLDGQID